MRPSFCQKTVFPQQLLSATAVGCRHRAAPNLFWGSAPTWELLSRVVGLVTVVGVGVVALGLAEPWFGEGSCRPRGHHPRAITGSGGATSLTPRSQSLVGPPPTMGSHPSFSGCACPSVPLAQRSWVGDMGRDGAAPEKVGCSPAAALLMKGLVGRMASQALP